MTVGAEPEYVTAIWVQIAHTLLLGLGSGGALGRIIPLPVLQNETEVDDVSEEGKTEKAEASSITGLEATGLG